MLSCKSTNEAAKQPECPGAVKCKIKDMTGMDGCKWVIVLADDRKLEPVNLLDYLPNPKDEMTVFIAYRPVKTMSVCMVGETVAITCLQLN